MMSRTLDAGLRRVPERSDVPKVRPVASPGVSSSSASRLAAPAAVDRVWAMYAAEAATQDAKRRSLAFPILDLWPL